MQDAQVTQASEGAFDDEPDMFFGVFQSIGEDLGINPFYLRVVFLAGLFFSPLAVIGAYAALGAVVALSRWLFPKPCSAAAAMKVQAVVAEEPVELKREEELIAA